MAYQNLTLQNIAGEITAQFNDGSFRSLTPPDPSSGDTAAFIGTASTGITREFFRHVDLSRTFTEFGADSEIAKMVQTAKASDQALPIVVSRIGARSSSLTIKRDIAGSHEKETYLRIVPSFLQEADSNRGRAETLDALKMILIPYVEGSLVRQRMILGLENPSGVTVPVYDSERLLVANGESVFDVQMNLPIGEVLYTQHGLSTTVQVAAELQIGGGNAGWSGLTQAQRIEKLQTFNDVVNFEWDDAEYLSNTNALTEIYLLEIYGTATQANLSVATGFDTDIIVGSANKALSNKSQRYVGTDLAYKNLQFENVGYIYCEGCHADTECVDLDALEDETVPVQMQWPNNKLGNLWKFEYNGQEYSYMFGRNNPFDAAKVDDYSHAITDPGARATVTIDDIVFNQNAVGVNVETIKIDTLVGADNPAAGAGGAADQALVVITGAAGALVVTVTPHDDGADDVNDVLVTKAALVDILNGDAADHPGIHVVDGTDLIGALTFTATTAETDALTTEDSGAVAFAAGRALGTFNLIITLTDDQKKLGDLLNLVDFHFDGSANAVKVESVPNDKGRIDCFVDYDAAMNHDVAIQTPFADITFSALHGTFVPLTYSHRLRPSLVGVDDATLSMHLKTVEHMHGASQSSVDDPFVMTHHDLTGQFVPEGVLARLVDFIEDQDAAAAGLANPATLVAAPAQVREVSFLQQAAQAAYVASTNYSQCIAVVPTSAPENADRGLQRWAGQPASYEVNSQGELKVTQDGTGLLGNKLLAGRTDYRNGSAFGGIMLTNGADLPNQMPYGIDANDEARDAYGEAIDIGKHVVVVGAYGVVADPESVLARRRTNQTGGIYTNAGPKICGILNALAPGNEPIGQINGRVGGLIPRHSTTMSVLNNLALLRVCMIGQDGVISSIYTAAQPSSDYRKISAIMSSNAILKQLRGLAMPYIGRPFKDEEVASLSQSIDGAMKRMVSDNYAQSIDVSLSASRLDRINGVLRASVRFVPPLSIEAITVEITLEPPAAGI